MVGDAVVRSQPPEGQTLGVLAANIKSARDVSRPGGGGTKG